MRHAVAGQRQQLLAWVRSRAGSDVDAEEILHAALERALSKSDQVRDVQRSEAWVARIVRNVLMDDFRRKRRSVLPIDELELAPIDGSEGDCWCVLVQVGQLKSDYAVILRRVIVEGERVAEVATDLGLSPNNAMVRLHRARQALKVRLEKHCGTKSVRACSDCGCEERGCCPQP